MFRNSRLITRVIAGFAVAMLTALGIGAVAWSGVVEIERETALVAEEGFPGYEALTGMDRAQTDASEHLNALALRWMVGKEERAALQAEIEEALRTLAEKRKAYDALPRSEEAQAVWRDLQPRVDAWLTAVEALRSAERERDQVLAAGEVHDGAVMDRLEERIAERWAASRRAVKPLDEGFDALMVRTADDVAGAHVAADRATTESRSRLLWALGLGTSLLAGLVWALARSVHRVVAALCAEERRLTDAVQAGELAVRADPGAVGPEFRPVIDGLNHTMDAFLAPLRQSADYMDRLSRGVLPPPIAETYQGEFETTKQALNRSIAAVGRMVGDADALAAAAVEGRLAERADASRHEGEFRRIVEGLNRTLETVVAPLAEATAALERLAAKDLCARIDSDHPGEYAKIKVAFNATAAALHDTLAQAAESAAQVSSAASQIASASQGVANGASEQASALEETSSSLESMASMTKGSADNAQQANGLAQTARTAATEGASAMEQMALAMAKIRASADHTSQIIKDINEITFQTNLLALNAAVEAARAGDAGRGFAVVAEEVRSLALRSKEAAQKTEALIHDSVKQTEEGVRTTKLVQAKLSEIGGSIAKVGDIVAEITASAKEQAVGIEQVTRAVGEMDKVTQQNAASSEESSSAAAELSSQASELAELVAAFQLERAATPAQLAPAARPAPRLPAAAAPPASAARRAPPAARVPPAARIAPAKRNGANGKGSPAPRPEDVIPFDDDTPFREF
jgi:methyl-accepting chemotaxis protein